MTAKRDTTKLVIPLNCYEQHLLLRYIEAEKQEPEFIARGMASETAIESFLYFHYSGHGCADTKQHIFLNESEIKHMFYPAEESIK